MVRAALRHHQRGAAQPALQPCWGRLHPFVPISGAECAPPPPPHDSEQPGPAFYTEGIEVCSTVNGLTDEQEAIAQFWSDDPRNTGTPPGHWIPIVGPISRAHGHSLALAVEASARTGIAVAGAFISCWAAKFAHDLPRPITCIDNVIDPAWTPLLATPPFPEHTSGRSTQSGAAATVLTDLFGDLPFVDDTHASRGIPARSFTSFLHAADEAAISRLYGGIHYRAAIEDGVNQGACAGDAILDNVRFLNDDEE